MEWSESERKRRENSNYLTLTKRNDLAKVLSLFLSLVCWSFLFFFLAHWNDDDEGGDHDYDCNDDVGDDDNQNHFGCVCVCMCVNDF